MKNSSHKNEIVSVEVLKKSFRNYQMIFQIPILVQILFHRDLRRLQSSYWLFLQTLHDRNMMYQSFLVLENGRLTVYRNCWSANIFQTLSNTWCLISVSMKFPIECKIFWLNYSWIYVLKGWNAQGKLLLRITGSAVKLNLLVVTVNRISSYKIHQSRQIEEFSNGFFCYL